MAKTTESYHLALFAYHLLFMTFVYQTVLKMKKWMPRKFKSALVTFSANERREYLEADSPWAYSKIKERTIFNLLYLLDDCDDLISRCKKEIVDFRNENLGHANPFIVSKDGFEKKIMEYEQIVLEIHQLTYYKLSKLLKKYLATIDQSLVQTKDDIEINLIGPNRLSDKDLEKFAAECLISIDSQKEQISRILKDDFNIFVNLIE